MINTNILATTIMTKFFINKASKRDVKSAILNVGSISGDYPSG